MKTKKPVQLQMLEKQWDRLSRDCKRELISVVNVIYVEQYIYSFGYNARKDTWEIHRFDRFDEFVNNAGYTVVDEWR